MTELAAGDRALLPGGIVAPAAIHCAEGRIARIERRAAPQGGLDARGLLILPAIVDLHGDAFERQIHPRPTVTVEREIALAETDRQMLANGIGTAFHGLTVTWEPGQRSLEAGLATLSALRRMRRRLGCDTRLHLRHEILSLDTVDHALGWIADGVVELLAFNDHGKMVERVLARPDQPNPRAALAGLSEAEYRDLAARAFARRPEVPASLERLAAAARRRGIPLASHDDRTAEARLSYHALGCRISEFPLTREAADAAAAAGAEVVLGAPNILRGGSHCGGLNAAELIAEGICTALCSDYYYPALLYAPFRLAAMGVRPFSECWDLVSRGPARAAGLADRGAIAPGRRADLAVVDDSDPLHPAVRAVFVAGVPVYTAAPAASLEAVSV